jgi:uncharacterized lipoprotein YddW (UPF0748 family)
VRSDKNKAIGKAKQIQVCFSFLLPIAVLLIPGSAIAQSARLGVVRSQENATQWGGIINRLNASGVSYCVLDLQNVRSEADLAGPAVLFLPNVETLTQEQAIALEAWMSKGGRVIVSGPVGNLSAPGVRQLLRTMLGAYWAFPLSEPTMVQPLRTRTQEWVTRDLAGTIHGGVVVPTGLNSQTAATWSGPDTPPAVVTTNRTTFFGWRWGVDTVASPTLDLGWLKAAMTRYGNRPGGGTTVASQGAPSGNCLPPGAIARASATTRQSPQTPTRILGTGSFIEAGGQGSRGAISEQGSRGAGEQGRVASPPPVSAVQQGTPTRQRVTRQTPAPTAPRRNDPTQDVAAAGIPFRAGGQRISSGEAIAMSQELENLIGRVESALLAANTANRGSGRVAEAQGSTGKTDDSFVASPTTSVATVASTVSLSTQPSAPAAIQSARELLQNLPRLIANRDYANARQQWLQARQNLWNLYPIDRPNAQAEIRAIWLDRGSIIEAGSEQGLARIFDQLAAAGINTVFFETVNAGYSIYPSQVAPEQNPLVRGWDPLASAVKLAHARGMELHAWVWTFAAGNQIHNTILGQPANYLGPVLTANPSWANYDNRGNIIPIGQTKPFLDPANPEVRQYLMRLFEEIVTRYKVDGLQLDYIRYPFQDPGAGRIYGYGRAARQQFQQQYGVDPMRISPRDRTRWQQWTEFRTSQINSFVAEVSQMLRQRRSNLILSVAVFGYPEPERIQKLQQNWEVWARQGDVDLIVPMTYAPDTNRFQQLAQPWLTNTNLGSSLISPGIYLLRLPEVGAIDQIQLVRDLPSGGYSLFALEHFGNNLQAILSRTQGIRQGNTKEPIPFREPFAAAAARFGSLSQEWNFLLDTNQLRLEIARSNWTSKTEELATALNKLAQEPNASNFAAARQSLTTFRTQFPMWMSLHTTQNWYQVQTWENRLLSMERLLNYGERILINRQNTPNAQQ